MNVEKALEEIIDYTIQCICNETGESEEDIDPYLQDNLIENLESYLNSKSNNKSKEENLATELCNEIWGSEHSEVIDLVSKKIRQLKSKLNTNKFRYKSNKKTFVKKVTETVSEDMSELSVRLFAKQIAKTVQEPLIRTLTQTLQLEENNDTKSKIAAFLSTDIGFGVVSLLCSAGISSLPLPGASKEILSKISKEMRIQGEMNIGDPLVEMVMAPLRDALTKEVLALPIPGLMAQLPQNAEKVSQDE